MGPKIFALVVILVFFAVMIGIGFYYNKKGQADTNSDDYILAGRKAPLLIVAGSLFATWVSSATVMGYAGSGFTVGLGSFWSGASFIAATMWMGIWLIPRLRKAGITTVPELFEHYFGPAHRLVALLLSLGRDLGVIASISIALAQIFQSLFGISQLAALCITVGVVLVFTASGGMWAVLVTDTIQSAMIIVGSVVLIPLGIWKAGGFAAFCAQVPATHVNPVSAGFSQTLGWILLGCFISFAYQTVLQRGLAAKDDETAKKCFLYGGGMAMLWYITPFMVGMVARVVYPTINASDAYLTMCNILGPYAGAFFVVCLMASCMSTISSCIPTTTANITLDVYKRFLNPKASDKQVVKLQRICLFVIVIVCAWVGKMLPYILELFWIGGRIMASGLAPVFVAIILWPRARRAPKATLLAMICGAAFNIAAQAYQSSAFAAMGGQNDVVTLFTLDPVLAGLPACFVVLIVGVLLETRGQTREYLLQYKAD